MEPHTYIVEKIEGDYAYLKQTDAENPELFQGAEPALAMCLRARQQPSPYYRKTRHCSCLSLDYLHP